MKTKCLVCEKKLNIPIYRVKAGRGKYCSLKCKYKGMEDWIPWNKGIKGSVKPNKTSFKKGNIPWTKGKKGIHMNPATEFKKGNIPWSTGKQRSEITGKNHPLWKGDAVQYNALHSWIYRTLGQPSFCNRCKTIKSKRFMWHNISGKYKREITDWERVCARCHAHEHKAWEARWHT